MFDVVSFITAVVPCFFAAVVFLSPEFPLTHRCASFRTKRKNAQSFGNMCPWDAVKVPKIISK